MVRVARHKGRPPDGDPVPVFQGCKGQATASDDADLVSPALELLGQVPDVVADALLSGLQPSPVPPATNRHD